MTPTPLTDPTPEALELEADLIYQARIACLTGQRLSLGGGVVLKLVADVQAWRAMALRGQESRL